MDYVPPKRNERYLWFKNLSANAVAEAAKIGAPPADATAVKALTDAIVAKMDATDAAQTATDGARQIETATAAANLPALRAKVRNWKTLPGYPASGSEAVLKLKGAEVAFDPTTYKPVLTLSVESGKVKIEFNKLGVDGLAIYSRVRGAMAWRKIGTDTDSPYFDSGPLAQPGVPEVREYMARGMIKDDEVGLDSDIASITFAG